MSKRTPSSRKGGIVFFSTSSLQLELQSVKFVTRGYLDCTDSILMSSLSD